MIRVLARAVALALAAALFLGGVIALALILAVAALTPRPWVDVGSLRLFRCLPGESGIVVAGYCDVIRVPLDWNDPTGTTIGVRFEWIPAKNPYAPETIVAQDGGPGYPSTGTGYSYRRLFGTLLKDRNLLLMDERGTGRSTAIDCAPLQRALTTPTSHVVFQRTVAACGAQLDHTFRARGGRGYVRASDLFSATQSVKDLAKILHDLRLPPVDLYGASYGSFFAQTFAAEYPHAVRSLILEGAYPLDQSVFDPAQGDEIRSAFAVVCTRSIACSSAAPGSSLARIRRLARRLESGPLKIRSNTYDESDLVSILQGAGETAPMVEYRELDAAARAWLDHGDAVPLARLFGREDVAGESPGTPATYSAGMQTADECTVYENPFDLRSPFADRVRQYHTATAVLPPASFDPISKARELADPPFDFDQCLRWPAPAHEPPLAVTVPLVPNTLPVLIVSGELDTVTSPGDAARARAELGPSARLVTIRNMSHGTALADPFHCAQEAVRVFIVAPRAAIDTSCTTRIPEVRSVGVFPFELADEPRAMALPGDRAAPAEARLAAVAVAAAGDALQSARFVGYNGRACNGGYDYCGAGLRGGTFTAVEDLSSVVLKNYAYSRDTIVSGNVSIDDSPMWGGASTVTAHLRARTNDRKLSLNIVARWDERIPRARASIDGQTGDGRPIREEMPAP